MTDHTKEPWAVKGRDLRNNVVIAAHDVGAVCIVIEGETAEHDARRIVACVNACSWIPTETLEDERITLYWQKTLVSYNREKEIAEELLEDMKTLKNILGPSEPTCYGCTVEIEMALSVINRALELVKQ